MSVCVCAQRVFELYCILMMHYCLDEGDVGEIFGECPDVTAINNQVSRKIENEVFV